ncbi:phosphonate C-P lyase system protein PhnG [Acidiphilium sp.]|uniref:phosphonate C-P lyase system protein PhnG n=1 Tax=Acidiphilium sp. TaxID=527 RepID=UPI003D0646C0
MLSDPVAPDIMMLRPIWLGVLARARSGEIAPLLDDAPALAGYVVLRGPETGMAMTRGRIGGGGAVFNLGEITISRCSVRDDAGFIGHGYATGRDLRQVELIARLDAALQNPATRQVFDRRVIQQLAAAEQARRGAIEAQAAQTNVDFFTLATMRT